MIVERKLMFKPVKLRNEKEFEKANEINPNFSLS